MRPRSDGFFVPFCLFDEVLPDKTFKLLLFLLKTSLSDGECRVGYKAMRHAIRDKEYKPASSATVRKALLLLKRKRWISKFEDNGPKPMSIYMQIPWKYLPENSPKEAVQSITILKSVVHSQKQQDMPCCDRK